MTYSLTGRAMKNGSTTQKLHTIIDGICEAAWTRMLQVPALGFFVAR